MHQYLRHRLPILIVLAVMALPSSIAWAQQDFEVSVEANPRVVAPGQIFEYRVDATVQGNYDINLRQSPDFGPFMIMGSSSSPHFSIVNGNASRSLRLTYRLRAPAQQGTYSIGPPRLTVGRQSIMPNSREVVVTDDAAAVAAATPQRSRTNDRAFVEINVEPNRNPFVGEQLTIRYDLYVNQRNRGLRARHPDDPALDDFWVEEMSDQLSRRRTVRRHHGQSWDVSPLRMMAAFPLRAGPTIIDGLDVTLVRATLFGQGDEETFESQPIEIEVRPLPDGAPPHFNEGHVGDWDLRVRVDSHTARVGGQLVLTAVIDGVGRPSRLSQPHLPASDHFEVVNTSDEINQSFRQGRVAGNRTFRFYLMPLTEGVVEIPPLSFSYFDPEREEYITRQSDPISIQVEAGELPVAVEDAEGDGGDGDSLTNNILAELHDLLPPQALLGTKAPTLLPPWWTFLLPLVGLLLVLLEPRLTRSLRHRRAPLRRRRALSRRINALLSGEPDQLLRALRLTLNEGLGTNLGALTAEEVETALADLELPQELRDQTNRLVGRLIAQRYSPGSSQNKVDDLAATTRQVIDDLLSWQTQREVRKEKAAGASRAATTVLLMGLTAGAAALPAPASADEASRADEAFQAAMAASQEEDWPLAAQKWAQLAENSSDPTFHYNAGTAAAHAGDLGMARLHLERALFMGAETRPVRDNLDRVISAIGRQNPTVAAFPPQEMASTGIQHLAPLLIVLFLWLAFLVALIRRFTGHPRSGAIFMTVISAALALSIAAAAAWIYVEEFSRNAELGVVIESDQLLRVAPSHHAERQFDHTGLPPGAILRLRQELDGWVEVELPSGKVGWLPVGAVGLISER